MENPPDLDPRTRPLDVLAAAYGGGSRARMLAQAGIEALHDHGYAVSPTLQLLDAQARANRESMAADG